MPKLNMEISRLRGQGIIVQRVLDNLKQMKCELEALGCKVQIKVEGTELAGNGTRTRDILLGKNSVMVFPQSDAIPDACPDCGSPLVTICPPSDLIIKMFGQGKTYFECGHCGNCWAVAE